MEQERKYLLLVTVAICHLIWPSQAQSPPASPERQIRTHYGMCEASGAVALPRGSFDGHFVVANDNDNVLRVYATNQDGPALGTSLRFNSVLRENAKADIEGAAWIGDRIYWLGSHSRNDPEGEVKNARRSLFATVMVQGGSTPALALASQATAMDLSPVLRELTATAEALGDNGDHRRLSPERNGLNLEGLAATPDGQGLLIGLRGPLVNERAGLILITNPSATGGNPGLGGVAFLNLDGRGVRSLEYVPSQGRYLIMAGPTTDRARTPQGEPAFRLFAWSGLLGEAAVPVAGADPDMTWLMTEKFTPEAMIVNAAGNRIRLLSDDGKRLQGSTRCEEINDEARREFRSVVLPLTW